MLHRPCVICFTSLLLHTLLQVPNRTLAAAKEGAAKATVDVLNSYRKNCSEQSAPGQLVLPEALKLAPLYNLALSKCPAFRCGALSCCFDQELE